MNRRVDEQMSRQVDSRWIGQSVEIDVQMNRRVDVQMDGPKCWDR